MDALAQLNASLTGRYTIEREIGRGGMATVYLARDVRHARHVAVKVLNPELGAVLGVERFLAEIQVTANLQHPNLLPLFDSGEAEGLLFYVMPYVEGESLRAKLTREKQLPLDEAIHIATAVASALDYAHRHGVIHRDLKPENILLHEGEPLVADFGIALAVSKAGGQRVTQTGISLGTPQYMSPEQATGDRAIDGRTDIYSLGAVVYEMLTGEPPHSGTTAQAIIAKVITDRPRGIRLSRDTVPPHVEEAVERALAKLPADRFHSGHEFAAALQGKLAAVALPSGVRTPGTVEAPGATRRWRPLSGARAALWAGMSIGIAAASLAIWAFFAIRPESDSSVTFVIEPPLPGTAAKREYGAVAVSPDGKTFAFVVQSDSGPLVYARGIGDLEARPVPGTLGAFELALSPNGSWLAVLTWSRKLLAVPLDGAAPRTVHDRVHFWAGVTWENDRSLLMVPWRDTAFGVGAAIARISLSGGSPRAITRVPPGREAHARPLVGPDGKTLIFVEWGGGGTEDDFLAIGSLQTGRFTTTSLLAVQPVGVVNDRILYLDVAGAVMAVSFDARTQRVTGEPIRVIEDIPITGTRQVSLSATGTILYRRGQPTYRLALVDTLDMARELSPQDKTFESYESSPPVFSPDGRKIAASLMTRSGDTVATDVWTFDIAGRTFTRLTSLGNVRSPQWTPNGKSLLFGGGSFYDFVATPLWSQPADGSRPAEKLVEHPPGEGLTLATATLDGRGVLYCGRNATLFYLAFSGDRKPVRVNTIPPGECFGRLSPDGRWWAYMVPEEGVTPQVFVRPFEGPGSRLQVSPDGGDMPRWSRDGRRLYYRRAENYESAKYLYVAHLRPDRDGLSVVSRRRLVPLRGLNAYDLAPDGERFLMLEPARTPDLVVTTNWIPQLRARLAGTR